MVFDLNELKCPVTKMFYNEPVRVNTGYCFERNVVEDMICPITGCFITTITSCNITRELIKHFTEIGEILECDVYQSPFSFDKFHDIYYRDNREDLLHRYLFDRIFTLDEVIPDLYDDDEKCFSKLYDAEMCFMFIEYCTDVLTFGRCLEFFKDCNVYMNPNILCKLLDFGLEITPHDITLLYEYDQHILQNGNFRKMINYRCNHYIDIFNKRDILDEMQYDDKESKRSKLKNERVHKKRKENAMIHKKRKENKNVLRSESKNKKGKNIKIDSKKNPLDDDYIISKNAEKYDDDINEQYFGEYSYSIYGEKPYCSSCCWCEDYMRDMKEYEKLEEMRISEDLDVNNEIYCFDEKESRRLKKLNFLKNKKNDRDKKLKKNDRDKKHRKNKDNNKKSKDNSDKIKNYINDNNEFDYMKYCHENGINQPKKIKIQKCDGEKFLSVKNKSPYHICLECGEKFCNDEDVCNKCNKCNRCVDYDDYECIITCDPCMFEYD